MTVGKFPQGKLMNTVVLGLGNTLLGDDGVGIHAVNQLQREWNGHDGVRFVDGRGELITGGGKVVKNAAGFDLSKLMVGSTGRLGVLTELTFKVFPQPLHRSTITVQCRDLEDALTTLGELAGGPWDLEALDLEPPATLKIRLAGHPEPLKDRCRTLSQTIDRPFDILDGDAEIPVVRLDRHD